MDVQTRAFPPADFIGCSGYASMPTEPEISDMEVSIRTVAFELSAFGIDLKDYLFNRNKTMVYTEHGIGGIKSNNVAPDVEYIALKPFEGLSSNNFYSHSKNPWLVYELREYRRRVYKLMSAWGAAGGGPIYKVDAIFIWNLGTFDVLGVHPKSSSSAGSYGDNYLKAIIAKNNAAANAAYPYPIPAEITLETSPPSEEAVPPPSQERVESPPPEAETNWQPSTDSWGR